jgi:hypothetical protein
MNSDTQAAIELAKRALATALSLIEAETKETLATGAPQDLVRLYADLREEGEALRDSVSTLSKLEQDFSYTHIPAAFDAAGIQNVNVVGYGLVSLTRRWSCSMLNKTAAFEYLRKTGQGGMIIETVPAPTLGAWAREETEDKGREPPDDIFKTSIARHVSLRRSK